MSRRVLSWGDRPTAAYAACSTAASWRSQLAIWFQLVKIRLTSNPPEKTQWLRLRPYPTTERN
jgi:hypothetical protein